MRIAEYTEVNTTVWDNVPSCVVRMAGCNFGCRFCNVHNDVGEDLDTENVLNLISKNTFAEGVIITGGEPLIHRDLYRFLKEIKRYGKRIRLETNGQDPDALDDLIGANLVDFVSMDIKAPLTPEGYSRCADGACDIDRIRRSVDIVMESGADYEFVVTLVPTYTTIDEMESICKSIKGAKCLRLNQFVPGGCFDATLDRITPYKEKAIREMEGLARKFVKRVKVSGL